MRASILLALCEDMAATLHELGVQMRQR